MDALDVVQGGTAAKPAESLLAGGLDVERLAALPKGGFTGQMAKIFPLRGGVDVKAPWNRTCSRRNKAHMQQAREGPRLEC